MKLRRGPEITPALLRRWPLPQPPDGGGKDARGRVLVVAGSEATPGAARLAAEAALRAGAGRVTLVVPQAIATALALALPEAMVLPLQRRIPESLDADCVLIGPGLTVPTSVVARLLRRFARTPAILDASAMRVLLKLAPAAAPQPRLITPHAGELSALGLGTRDAIERDPLDAARRAAARWGVGVVLKHATTHIVAADGRSWRHRGGNPGLGISGSGDVLAGLIAGLVARGATLEQAAAWGVALHGRAGDSLARELGPLGYLASELARQVPGLMRTLSG